MKRSYVIALGIALVAALWLLSPLVETLFVATAGGGTGADATPQPALAQAALETEPIRVRVRRSLAVPHTDLLLLTGQTEPSRQATLRAETAGRVVQLGTQEGAQVAAGDIIVRLEQGDRDARLSEAKALVEQRRIEYEASRKLSDKGFQSQTRLAEARAALEAAQALLRRIELDIERTEIRAPFDGVLQQRAVEVGDYVGIGDPVALFVDLDPIIAVAQVSEREISGVAQGIEGEARLVSGETVSGTLRYVSAVGEGGTRTFRVELELANPDKRLAAGMTAEVRLPLRTVEAHAMPASTLTLDDEGVVGVKAVDTENRVRFHPVTVVADGADGIWVTGLPKDVRVITVGQEFVLPGQTVIPVPEDGSPAASRGTIGGAS